MKNAAIGTDVRIFAIDEQLPVFVGFLVIAKRKALIKRRGNGAEIEAICRILDVGHQARLLEQGARQIGRSGPLRHIDGGRLRPNLLVSVSVLADDFARHRKSIRRRRFAIGAVGPLNAVALFEDVTARADRRGLAVDEQLPVFAGLRIPAKREALIERRGDGVESPTPAVIGIVVCFQSGLAKQLLGQIGRGGPVCKREVLRGGPRLLITPCINANDRARGANPRIHDAAGTGDRNDRGDFLIRQLRVGLIVGEALGIAGVLLAGQARGDGDLRIVLRLRDLQVLVGDDGLVAGLERAPALRAHAVVTRQINRHDARRGCIGGAAIVAPSQVAIGIKVGLLERMQIARNGLGVLAVQDGGGIARLRLLHKGKLGIHVCLIKRLDLVIKRFACRNLGVRLVGNRQRDAGCRRGFPRLRLVNRALVAVERHVVGAGGVFDLVVFAVYAKRARGGHLQVIGKAVFVGNGVSAGVLHVIVREAGVHLLLQRGLFGGNLVRIALDGDVEGMGARNASAIAAGVAEQLDGCGQHDLAVRRGARDGAGIIAPPVTTDLHLVAGAFPRDLVFIGGAGTIRKCDLAGNGVGVVAVGIADGQLLGNVIQALLKHVLVPGNKDATRSITGGFAVLGKGKRDLCRAQAIEVVARILVRVHVEERDVAVGVVIGGGNANRHLVARGDELDGVHLGGNALEAHIGDLRLKHAVEVGVVAVFGHGLDVFLGQLLHHRIDRIAIDDLVGEHGFHAGGTASRNNLQVLAGSRGGHGDACAFHAFELGVLPVSRIGGEPREGDAIVDLHAVDGVRIGSLGLSLGRHGVAGDEMGGGADGLRRGDHAQQIVLARCGNRGARHPFDRVVQGIRRDFK